MMPQPPPTEEEVAEVKKKTLIAIILGAIGIVGIVGLAAICTALRARCLLDSQLTRMAQCYANCSLINAIIGLFVVGMI